MRSAIAFAFAASAFAAPLNSGSPSNDPTGLPYGPATGIPSSFRAGHPSAFPTELPSRLPTMFPSGFPSLPSGFPSFHPSGGPKTGHKSGHSLKPASTYFPASERPAHPSQHHSRKPKTSGAIAMPSSMAEPLGATKIIKKHAAKTSGYDNPVEATGAQSVQAEETDVPSVHRSSPLVKPTDGYNFPVPTGTKHSGNSTNTEPTGHGKRPKTTDCEDEGRASKTGSGHVKPTEKAGHSGKPERSGKPEQTGKPEHSGQPGPTGKPAKSGKSEQTGKPESTGKPEATGKSRTSTLKTKHSASTLASGESANPTATPSGY